jgi:hypothetical protein
MRKQTRGRKIQIINVPEYLYKLDAFGIIRKVKNDHPKAGKVIQVKHKPTRKLQSL